MKKTKVQKIFNIIFAIQNHGQTLYFPRFSKHFGGPIFAMGPPQMITYFSAIQKFLPE